MSITDELRRYIHREMWDLPRFKGELRAIADRIDAEHERELTIARGEAVNKTLEVMGDGYIALPKDADGEVIHVGDWIIGDWDAKAKVVAITSEDVYWWEHTGCHWCHAHEVRLYHKPTVEDVLDEFASAYDRIGGEDEEHQKYLNLIAEYAAKLRLAGDDE